MEILTYVLSGRLAHRDSLGHGAELKAGEVQRITAGRGILHSEVNPSADEPVHLYQIWIRPREPGLTPSYEQDVARTDDQPGWQCLAAPADGEGLVTIQQDARVWLGTLADGASLDYALAPGRHAWLQVLRGKVTALGRSLTAGDGLAVSEESAITLTDGEAAEVLLFDLA
jgi:redox-sensitive bicupin YhaK (pirin superfamily)